MVSNKHRTEYNQNHICVYMGYSTSKGFFNQKVQETSDSYFDIDDVVVYIDGIEYGGSTEAPFCAFAVSPGYHVVKVVGYKKFGGRLDRYIESKAQQVNVTDKSAFLFYHWNFYSNSKGLNNELFVKTFDNVNDFLRYTHQD